MKKLMKKYGFIDGTLLRDNNKWIFKFNTCLYSSNKKTIILDGSVVDFEEATIFLTDARDDVNHARDVLIEKLENLLGYKLVNVLHNSTESLKYHTDPRRNEIDCYPNAYYGIYITCIRGVDIISMEVWELLRGFSYLRKECGGNLYNVNFRFKSRGGSQDVIDTMRIPYFEYDNLLKSLERSGRYDLLLSLEEKIR
jgi:hypothetical protein